MTANLIVPETGDYEGHAEGGIGEVILKRLASVIKNISCVTKITEINYHWQ
jgi:hypothetical protein